MAERAEIYAAGLWNGTRLGAVEGHAPDWWATISAERSFATEISARREMAALFGRLGPLLWIIAAAGFALQRSGGGDAPAGVLPPASPFLEIVSFETSVP